MKKKEIQIETLESYIQNTSITSLAKTLIYRGECKLFDKPVCPKIGRSFNRAIDRERELEIYNEFKKKYIQYSKFVDLPDIEILALGQHTGLETRLIDFTFNPLIALFFALENRNSNDYDKFGAYIYCIDAPQYIPIRKEKTLSFNQLTDINNQPYTFQPRYFFERINRQNSVLLYSNIPHESFIKLNQQLHLQTFIILGSAKKRILSELFTLGISKEHLFPGLDSLCESINYKYGHYYPDNFSQIPVLSTP